MRKKYVQMFLFDIYNDVSEAVENKKPKVISLLEEHIDFENIILQSFYRVFYSRYMASSVPSSDRLNHVCIRYIRSIVSIPRTGRPCSPFG